MQVIIFQSPLVQLNTPYPSGAYLKSFFSQQDIMNFSDIKWFDLSNLLYNNLFSKEGLTKLFELTYETALEKVNSYSFSSSAEEEFYYDIYVGQEKYDEAFLLLFSHIQENYDDTDTISEERIEKLKQIYDFLSAENQEKMDQFEKNRKELIETKEKQESLEREQKEQEQKAETKEVPNEESNVKEENNESATVETKDNKSIVEQSEMDEGEASTDEPIQYQYVEYKDLMRYEEQYVGQYVSMWYMYMTR